MIENLDKIKQAIDVEIKYRYINIHGKTQTFASFIMNEAKKIIKNSKKAGVGEPLSMSLKIIHIVMSRSEGNLSINSFRQ